MIPIQISGFMWHERPHSPRILSRKLNKTNMCHDVLWVNKSSLIHQVFLSMAKKNNSIQIFKMGRFMRWGR